MEFNFKSSDIVKHSAAHALAAGVKRIFPTVKFGLGPVTRSGFYYDFELERPLETADLAVIEKNIEQIIQENLPFNQMHLSKQEGIDMLLQIGQGYKAEVLKNLTDDNVSFFKLGEEFIDLCRGPHVKTTGDIGIVKLISIEETNWNNDASRPKMYRVHGVVFQNIVEYNDYLESSKLQERRDVIKLAIEKSFIYKDDEKYYFTEKGSTIVEGIKKHVLAEFEEDHAQKVLMPSNIDYKSAFKLLDKSVHNQVLSYKILPKIVTSELQVQNEILQNTAPILIGKIYMQNGKELVQSGDFIEKLIDITNYITKQDINITIRCTDLENKLVQTISTLLQKRIISHSKVLSNKVNGIAELELNVIDSVGKEWVLCRCFIPNINEDRLSFRNAQNQSIPAVEIGVYFDLFSIFAYLVEEFEYDVPFKFKPIQAVCIPKSNAQIDFATSITNHLRNNGIRASLDNRAFSLQKKIFEAEKKQIPFILIVGAKEETNNAVSIRRRNVEIGLMSNENLINFINENKEKR